MHSNVCNLFHYCGSDVIIQLVLGQRTYDWLTAKQQFFLYYEGLPYLYVLSVDWIVQQLHGGKLKQHLSDYPQEGEQINAFLDNNNPNNDQHKEEGDIIKSSYPAGILFSL